MIHEVKGNLLDSNCDYICHQVNCQGKMNSGMAKSIREKWPVVYNNYIIKCNQAEEDAVTLYGGYEIAPSGGDMLIGNIQIIDIYEYNVMPEFKQYLINMFAQQYYGYDGRRYTSYDAFWSCLEKIREEVPEGSSIAFPDHIGSCRGGANWNVIRTMIAETLGNKYEVYIYKLEE